MKMKRVKFERYVKEFWAMSLEYIESICQKMRRGLHYSKELASRIETILSIYESRKSEDLEGCIRDRCIRIEVRKNIWGIKLLLFVLNKENENI